MNVLKAAIGSLAVGFVCVSASADTLTWKTAGGGKWSDAANWLSNGTHTVPQSGDTIIIASLPGGATCENDIEGLECPHLELGSASSSSPYAAFSGKQVKLTGGWNALKTTSGRFTSTMPLYLTVASDGNPTNRLDVKAGRVDQLGKVSGPGLLYVENGNYFTLNEDNDFAGGAFLSGGTVDFNCKKGGMHVAGGLGQEVVISGNCKIRLYGSTFNENYRFVNQSNYSGYNFLCWNNAQFAGTMTGERLAIFPTKSSKPVVNGAVTVGRLQVRGDEGDASDTKLTFNGLVRTESVNAAFNGVAGPTSTNRLQVVLAHADNELGTVYLQGTSLIGGCKNAFGAATVVYPGVQMSDRGTVDLAGFDQTIDRLALNEKYPIDAENPGGHVVTSSKGAAALTLAATEDCETDALFSGDLTLVWNPQDDHAFQTYAAFGREMTMNGAIVVSNGTFKVNGANSFPNATAVEVADGATFVWASSASLGLRAVSRLTLGEGATFEVADGCKTPFGGGTFGSPFELDLASSSHLVLKDGVTLTARTIRVDGQPLDDNTTYGGAQGVPGETYLPALAGGNVKIRTQSTSVGLSAKAYAQNGLVCLLDGIENAGYGEHDNAATVWTDLTGLTGDFAVSNCSSFTENALHKNKSGLMAMNTARRTDIVTIESAVSGIETAVLGNGQCVMPVFFNTDQNIIIKRPSATSRRLSFDNKKFGWQMESLPDAATVTAFYTPLSKALGFFVNATVPEGELNAEESWSSGSAYMTIGGRHISWAGSDTTPYGYSVHAVRFYTRELTGAEVTNNWVVDSVRYRNVFPADTADYRSVSDGRAFACRLTVRHLGGTVTVDGQTSPDGSFWPELGQTVTLTVATGSDYSFDGWTGDTDAIVSGSVTDPTVRVLVDRALTLTASMRATTLVVSDNLRLTRDTHCSGIRFLGPYAITADDGVTLTLDEDGDGIEIAEGTSGTVSIACPFTAGGVYGGAEQTVSVPKGVQMVVSGPFDGAADLRFTGSGSFRLPNGSDHTGDWTFESGDIRLSGVISDRTGVISFSQPGVLTLDAADVGKLVAMNGPKNEVRLTCANNTENYLRSGWKQTATVSSPQGAIKVGTGAELTIETTYNGTGVNGIYPTIKGPGILHLRTDTDKISSLSINESGIVHVWKPMYQVTRSNYNRLYDGSKLYFHCENALTKAPWCFRGYVDLGGFDQTCGRFSYVSEVSNGKWTMYTTGEIHSDEPATLTVYHDTNAAGGGNIGWQAFGGKFTGKVSLVKTGATTDQSMTTNDLVLAATSTSTGSVGVTWGLLSFANFTSNNIVCLGSWPNCTELSASGKGTLELCHSKAVGKKADLRVGVGGKVRLQAGVRQSIRNLYLPTGPDGAFEMQETCLTYGSSQSGAQVKLDAYFEGPGVINCRGENPGILLLVR